GRRDLRFRLKMQGPGRRNPCGSRVCLPECFQPEVSRMSPCQIDGAVEKTRTSTGCPTATSTLRVYQFRHDRSHRRAGNSGEATERKEGFAEIGEGAAFPAHSPSRAASGREGGAF